MPIFARRSLQRAVDSLARHLTPAQLGELVGKLEGHATRDRVAAEWETVVTVAFAKTCSNLAYESDCGGRRRPDIRATVAEDLELVADIRTVSDADMEDDNPVERFRDEVFRAARELGMSGAGLFLHADSIQTTNERERRILAVPHRRDLAAFVEDHVRPFLRLIAEAPTEDRVLRYDEDDVHVHLTLEYRSSETNFSGGSWQTYTWARTPTHNPVYRALEEKAEQLRHSGFQGNKGIILCDGGCHALANALDSIVEAFFRQHRKTVLFIAAIDLPEARGLPDVRRFLRHAPRMRVFWNPHLESAAVERLGAALQLVTQAIPSGVIASQYARYDKPNPELRYLNSFEGGFSVSSASDSIEVRVSARAALHALGGDVRHWPGVGHSVPVELFQAQLGAGRTIRSIRLESSHDDDDDWVVIELGRDPAIAPICVPDVGR